MTLTGRSPLIDRPELVNREGGNDIEDNQETEEVVETLGEGGGPVKHGIEFQEGQFNLVAASNAIAVLASANDEGTLFEEAFTNAALQLYDQLQRGGDIRDLTRFSMATGLSELNLSDSELDVLAKDVTEDETDESEEDIEEVLDEADVDEEEIEDMVESSDDDESEDGIEDSEDE